MMFSKQSSRPVAILLALVVTLLWASSWVLIKVGLADIPALTFAGLRYGLAFLCLLPFAVRSSIIGSRPRLPARAWAQLAALGITLYALTQGAQFVGLAHLPALTVSLLLNLTSPAVALLGVVFLSERLTAVQWAGILLALAGAVLYFTPVSLPAGETRALIIVLIGVLANALSLVLGRQVNRSGYASPLVVTSVSMGVGALILTASGITLQGLPGLTLRTWVIVGWLAVVNTAVAFTLWNHTLRTLRAAESSIINGTMLIHIAVLAWIFLGEQPTLRQGIGMLAAGAGTLIVQLRRS